MAIKEPTGFSGEQIDWEAIHQQVVEKVREWAIASGKKSSEEEIEKYANNVNNTSQFFPYERGKKKKGYRSYIDEGLTLEQMEQTTPRQRGLDQPSEDGSPLAVGPEDFFSKNSEKFFDTTIAQFYRDIDEACRLTGLTEEDFIKRTYERTQSSGKIYEEKLKALVRTMQYLIAVKGYIWGDIAR